MSRAEGVIHVDVAQSGIGLGEFLVVLLFALVATAVFKHNHLARLDLHAFFQVTARKRNGHAHEFAHTNGDAGVVEVECRNGITALDGLGEHLARIHQSEFFVRYHNR